MTRPPPESVFDAIAADYAGARYDYPPELIDRLAVGPRGAACDIGCGPGLLTVPLATRFDPVIGVDVSTSMLNALQARSADGVAVVRASGERLPFADAVFSVVTFSQSLHWMNATAAVAEARRVLARDGMLARTWQRFMAADSPVEALCREVAAEVLGEDPSAGHVTRMSDPLEFMGPAAIEDSWSLRVEMSAERLGVLYASRAEMARYSGEKRRELATSITDRAAGTVAYEFEVGLAMWANRNGEPD